MYRASVVITTKNRKDDLRRALESVSQQTAPVETIVFDDGSKDETAQMVKRDFPTARLVSEPISRGLIVRRNELASLASGNVIFSLDDDAAFSTPYVVEQTLQEFGHPRVGAVAIPFVNVRQDDVVRQRASSTNEIDVLASFVGTAYALRRDVFLNLGGYRAQLIHQGEEGDFCIRLLQAGFVVRAGTADPIFHYESPRRSFQRMDYYGRRNDILFAWHNCPLPYLFSRAAAATLAGTLFGFRVGRPIRMGVGLLSGYLACARFFRERRPVSTEAYRTYRELIRCGPLPMATIESRLPPLSMERFQR